KGSSQMAIIFPSLQTSIIKRGLENLSNLIRFTLLWRRQMVHGHSLKISKGNGRIRRWVIKLFENWQPKRNILFNKCMTHFFKLRKIFFESNATDASFLFMLK